MKLKQLTKTDFIQFLNCPESLWLFKNKPDQYPKGEFSLFLKKLIKEGYETEEYAKKLFLNGVEIPESAEPSYTEEQLKSSNNVFFQSAFITKKGQFARVDILEKLSNESFHIYEIKSSTSIKTDKKHNHLKDACFQKFIMQECGYQISKVSIIHLNKHYVKSGEIDAQKLLEIVDVTDEIDEIYSGVVNEINFASTYINREFINEFNCSCKTKTRSNHCDSFKIFNKIKDYNIYELRNIREKKITELVNFNNEILTDVPHDFKLNDYQKLQIESLRQGKPIIDNNSISALLSDLKYPLHFIDYETYASAIPKIDGLSPHKHLTFQVSIHTMEINGQLTHYEHLAYKMDLNDEMLNGMKNFTGIEGTFISWHASFEIARNNDMINWIPDFKDYLDYINQNMFDLEVIFKKYYVDYKFRGSSSIKKVLPVICPEFSYSELDIQDGTSALDTWGRLVEDKNFSEDKEETKKNLLSYCELDTLAMVKIYESLKSLN